MSIDERIAIITEQIRLELTKENIDTTKLLDLTAIKRELFDLKFSSILNPTK